MLRVWGLVCRVLRLRCAVSTLAILLPVLAGGLALAQDTACTVSSLEDSNTAGTLRACLNNPSAEVINITATGTITLASPLPRISTSLTISGPGASSLTVSGNNSTTVGPIFTITSGTVMISGLTIANGAGGGFFGGGIDNDGTLTVSNCTISGNSARSGGGISNLGTLTVSNCTFSGNSTGASGAGGAIANQGRLTVTESTFSGNSATNEGGAIVSQGSTVTVTDSIFSGNSTGGDGGGINNLASTLTVTNSTFSGNSAANGGGIFDESEKLTVSNSTFFDNSAAGKGAGAGGGIASLGSALTVLNSTIFGNSSVEGLGGGIFNESEELTVSNSILSGDTGGDCSGSGCPTNGTNGNVVTVAADVLNLLPLGNYGGPTQTMLPLPGSAAICAGLASAVPDTPGTTMSVTTDQRGFPLSPSTCPSGKVDAGAVQTNYLTVTTSADPGTGTCPGSSCSLREAIATASDEDIDFSSTAFPPTPGTPTTITLSPTSGGLTISGQVNIVGPGANVAAVSGIEDVGAIAILTVDSGADAFVYGLTITGGDNFTVNTTTGDGGAIDNEGTLTVSNSTISGNGAIDGGGIFNDTGTLTVSNSTISGNSANIGGGIFNGTGTLTVSNSTISGNSSNEGEGIDNQSGTVTVSNSTISGNFSAVGFGAGGDIENDDTLTLANSIVGFCGGSGCSSTGDNGNVIDDTASQIMLAPLGFYGGATQTMPPLPGSPALGAGVVEAGEPTTDQRGAPRPSKAGDIDSGAVQISGEPPLITAVTPNSGSTAGGTRVMITGTGLDDTIASVDFGDAGAAGNLSLIAATGTSFASLTVTSPTASSAGTVDVTVTNNFGTSAASPADQFTYIAPPVTELAFTAAPPSMLALDGNAGTVAVAEGNTGGMTVATAADTITLTVTGPNSFSQTFTATAVSGVASFNLSSVTLGAAGSYTYTASIAGNATVTPATAMETVSKGTPTITTLPTASAITFGQTLASSTLMGGAANFDGTTVAGTFTYTAPATAPDVGTPSESVTFTPNDTADFNTVTGMVTVTVNKAMAMVTLGSLTQTFTGSPLAATATTNPAGLTVDFTYNGSTTAPTAAGSYTVVATISDSNHQGSATGTLVIGKATATVTLGSLTQTFTGSPLAETATTNPAGLTVDFTYNGSTTAPTAAASYTVVGTISDPNHQGSATGTLTVSAAPLTVTANNATKVYGTANPAFTGTVTGAEGDNTFTESFTTPATQNSNVGAYAITPSVTGAALSDYTVSATPGTLTVTQAATTTTLAASASSLTPGQSLTLTAQVADTSAGSAGTPAGTVSFYDGSTLLGTVTLSGGVASYSTTALAAGVTNTLTASYSGNTNFTASSTMAGTTVSVTPLDFTFTSTGASAYTAAPGAVATYSFGVSPLSGSYAGPVSFAVTGLPAGAMASFTPSSVAAGGGAQTVTMSVQTAAATAHNRSPFGRGIVLAFLLLPFAAKRRVREKLKDSTLLLVLLMAGLTATLTGCGSTNGFTLQSPQTYTLTVTAAGGSVQHSLTTTLIVQ